MASAIMATGALADSVKPIIFGPFFMNQVNFTASPMGYDYVLTNGFYHFQVGWVEPLSEGGKGLFSQTYFETNGNLNISPFTSDLGTTFNLKPMRYLEVGLSYNRMLYHNSLLAFAGDSNGSPPANSEYLPRKVLTYAKELGGADVFTYQANLTFDIGKAQLYLFASRTLWDIDAKGESFAFEYGDELLIATRDRINKAVGQLSLDLRPWSLFRTVSFLGIDLRDEYWLSDHTELKKNLISFGINGFRFGRNPEHQRRGLDVRLGYWTLHDQIPSGNTAKSLLVMADWKWNIHFLKM
ncbi:MAG: hypothetical protein ABI036_04730 [Fibrobacteria bacterium]